MATSGSYNYSHTGTDIVTAALRKCGLVAEGETPTAQMLSDGLEDLERVAKTLQAGGIRLWKYEEMILFLVASQQSYDLGSTGGNFVKKSALVTTTLSADAANGASTVTLTSVTGVATTYYIGIVLDDNTIHWTTVNGAPVGSVVTLTAVTDGAATSGNTVYVYQTKAPRPLQVTQGRVQLDSSNETELNLLGRENYFSLANKSSSSTPTDFYYNPTLTNGKLYVYPTASDERQYLNLTTQIPIEDFDSAANDADFPQEWYLPLVWMTASQMYPEYGVNDPITVQKIEKEAEKWFEFVSGFDTEEADIVIEVDYGL